MYWSRVKTILIVLFLCINIFLLINMMITVNRTIVISTETVRNTIEVLQKNDITIKAEDIPTKIEQLSKLEIDNAIQDTDNFAEKVLGKGFDKQKAEGTNIYELGTATLEITGCEFIYTNTAAAPELSVLNADTAEQYCKKLLKRWGLNIENLVLSDTEQKKDDTYLLTFQYKYRDKNIYINQDNGIKIELSSEGSIFLKGYALAPRKLVSEKVPGRQATSILIEFIRDPSRPKDQEMTITDFCIGYYIDTKRDIIDFTYVKVSPVWRVMTDDGRVYYYDAVRSVEKSVK